MSVEAVKYPVIAGAARQIYGSSSLRTSGNNKQSKKRKNNHNSATSTTKQPKHSDEFADYEDKYGVLITEPHPLPPPFDPSLRVFGGDNYGARRLGDADNWKTYDRFETKGAHDHPGSSNYANVMHPDSDLMHMPNSGAHMVDDETDTDDRQDEQPPCTLGCLNSEFLCPHSCQCVPKFTRCNSELNCEFGEDEEDCGGEQF